MATLVLTKPDGTIERYRGDDATTRVKAMPALTQLAFDSMQAGVPFECPEGAYTIEL